MKRKKRVVVVDDDELTLKIVGKIAGQAGFDATLLRAGRDFQSTLVAEGKSLGLAIVDLVLPDEQSGWDIIDSIRGNSETVDLPILVLTAASISDAEAAKLEKQGARIMKKENFNVESFRQAMEHLFKSRKAGKK